MKAMMMRRLAAAVEGKGRVWGKECELSLSGMEGGMLWDGVVLCLRRCVLCVLPLLPVGCARVALHVVLPLVSKCRGALLRNLTH